MKRIAFSLIFIFAAMMAAVASDTNHYYWVHFADKKGTPYTIGEPEKYLSYRAMERRTRLNIAVDSLDLPVNPSYVEGLKKKGVRIHNVTKWLNGATVIATEQQAEALRSLPFVDDVRHYSRRVAMIDTTRQNYDAGRDTATLQHKRYDADYYGLGYGPITQLNGVRLHKRGLEGKDIMIGVCDGGFPGVDTLSLFKSMHSEGRLVDYRDFVAHRSTVYCDNIHGTMVLSTMAGNLPGQYVGTAPKASYVLCITEDTYTESPVEELNWASAAEYLDSIGVDVINSSLGYRGFDDTTLNHHYKDLNGKTAWMSVAGDIAASRGIIVVNSAGNEGRDGEHSISVPADAEHVLSVGAVWNNGNIAGFSSYGSTFDYRIKPDVCAQGVMVYVASPTGGYLLANGTSFSSPIMAGMMACLRQAAPAASVAEICKAVRMAGDRSENVNNRFGYGIPDMHKALRSLHVSPLNAVKGQPLNSDEAKKPGLRPSRLTDEKKANLKASLRARKEKIKAVEE